MTKRKSTQPTAEKTVRDIRRATRRKYSAEEKIRTVMGKRAKEPGSGKNRNGRLMPNAGVLKSNLEASLKGWVDIAGVSTRKTVSAKLPALFFLIQSASCCASLFIPE